VMPLKLHRRENKTLCRRGGREIVRTRVMHGDWIVEERFSLVEPGRKPGVKSLTHFSTQYEAERALDPTSDGGITRSDEAGSEPWRLGPRVRNSERWRLSR
jgi:hypothetical protein